MPDAAPAKAGPETVPARRRDLIVAPRDDGGAVVKDPRTGAYYQLGPEESFLLKELDGRKTPGALCDLFRQEFSTPLSENEVREFVDIAKAQGLVAPPGATLTTQVPKLSPPPPPAPAPAPAAAKQSIFYWRKNLFDPDRLFNRIEPLVRFVWTPAFVAVSLVAIGLAGVEAWAFRGELAAHFDKAARWETVLFVWLAVALVTTFHEFAHGLTCKHNGGEVHEVGFLMMFFMPCFYCNVSDAWLLSSKWKRMGVTLAGPYCDMCVWALAVFVWRLTPPDVMANYLAVTVMGICGLRTFLNANPFIKLDGYYFLSDYVEIPNLQAKAQGQLKATLRWLLWGADRPAAEPRGRFLLAYGLGSWLFPLSMLTLLLTTVAHYLASVAGPAGTAVALVGAALLLSSQFSGLFGGEVQAMVRTRPWRTAAWACVLLGTAAAMAWWERTDLTSGQFQLRPATRTEIRAEVAGFLRDIRADEGESVTAGQPLLRIEVPQIDSKLTQKEAERREVIARLKLLEIGPRPEEIAAQKMRIERAKGWRDLAKSDLAQAKQVYKADLARLDEEVAEYKTELEFATTANARAEQLFARGAMGRQEYDGFLKKKQVSETQVEQVEAKRRARIEQGTLAADAELVRRERELAEALSNLGLMEAGTRPEEIEAERAKLDRLKEEIAYLEGLRGKQAMACPTSGVVTTPHLKEALGRYYREGELICVVEEPALLEAEVSLDERAVARVRPGQAVELKVQVLPRETFTAKVDRVSPRAVEEKDAAKSQSKLIAHCRLDRSATELRPGMTGHARIDCGRRPLGEIVADRALRLIRTDYWWW